MTVTSSTTHQTLRDRLAREDGMAMIMAVIVTVVLLSLVGVAVAVSVQSSGATTRDDNVKRADEVAEAGLRVAVYRLNYIQPANTDSTTCINANAATAKTSDGTCHDTTETLANGSTFTYYDTPNMGSGASCVGYPVTSSSVLAQRCVTVSATSGTGAAAVTRRAQIRAVSYAGTPLFPNPGLIGLNGISINNQAYINGPATTNGALTMQNGAIIPVGNGNAVFLGPSGTASTQTSASYPTPYLQRTPAQGSYTLSPVDPQNSALVNDDYRITNGITSPKGSPYDPSNGCTMGNAANICWNPTYRTLTLNNHATLTLTGGVYNFCSLSINNGSILTVGSGARVAIYIDAGSPERIAAGSGCPPPGTKIANGGPAGGGGYSGYFNLDNQGVFSNPSQDPTAAIIYVYNNDGAATNNDHMLHENNQGTFYGTIYAPQSWFHLDNQAGIVGGVAAAQLTIDNQFHFAWDNRDASLSSLTSGVYFRTAWRECTPAPTNPNDPQSGC